MEATGNRALLLSKGPQYMGFKNIALLLLMKDHRDWVLRRVRRGKFLVIEGNFLPCVKLVFLPLLVTIIEESSKETGVEMVQDRCEEIFIKLKCIRELLRHLNTTVSQTVRLEAAMNWPATHSRSTGGRRDSGLGRCVCRLRGQVDVRTCVQSSAIPSPPRPIIIPQLVWIVHFHSDNVTFCSWNSLGINNRSGSWEGSFEVKWRHQLVKSENSQDIDR